MKKEELQKLVEKQEQIIEKLKKEIDELNIKLIDYDNLQHLNIEMQTELYMLKQQQRENEKTFWHLQDNLKIYETTFKVLSRGEE